MEPFEEERLRIPISFSDFCKNVSIIEIQNNAKIDRKRLDKLCNIAISGFRKFTNLNNNKQFSWQLSLLYDADCFRCLNDIEYRFYNRKIKSVFGYTSLNNRISFITNDLSQNNFDEIFIHELYHAQSIYYGLFINIDKDEIMADKFIKWMKENGNL